MTLRIGEVRVYPAPAYERRRGLYAWASVEVGGFVLDGFCVRRTSGGRMVVVFPRRTDAQGRQHPIVWLPDRRDRQSVQDQILAAVDLGELTR